MGLYNSDFNTNLSGSISFLEIQQYNKRNQHSQSSKRTTWFNNKTRNSSTYLFENGIYVPHASVISKKGSVVIKFWFLNHLETGKDFTVEISPLDPTYSDKFLIELPLSGGPYNLGPEEVMSISFGITLKEDLPRDIKPKFLINIKADGEDYLEDAFELWVFDPSTTS